MIRLAINGYGRIGRCVLRALYESGQSCSSKTGTMQVVAINELADSSTVAHLTKYDTTHGRFPGDVENDGDKLLINGDSITLLHEPDIQHLPWRELEVDVVLECSGAFSDRATAQQHINSGAKRVIFSQPAEPDVDATIVYGINHQTLQSSDKIISNASCTTNGIVPLIQVLEDNLGIECGTITTIHSAMNDQPVLDAYHHTDLRKTRASGSSIIPVDTGLARGVERILPKMAGKFEAQALRVPTLNVSAMDLTVMVAKETSAAEVNKILSTAAADQYHGVLGYTEEPLASCDFNHDTHSSIVDASQTRVSGGKMVKVLTWFDNEWAYANRMLDVINIWFAAP